MNVHVSPSPETTIALRGLEASGPAARFATVCAAVGVLLFVKCYALRPTLYVLSQYLWTPETGNFRRALLPTLAGFAWGGDPARLLPVVDAVSTIEIAGLGLVLCWGALRLADRPVLRLALLLLLCSGAVPHLLAARGSQDGFAALAVIGLAVALNARRSVAVAVLGALAVEIHEASIVYVGSVCVLNLLLAAPEPGAAAHGTSMGDRPRRTSFDDLGATRLFSSLSAWSGSAGGETALSRMAPALAGLGGAASMLAVVVLSTRVAPDLIIDVCRRHEWIAVAASPDSIRTVEPGTLEDRWMEICGMQFRTFTGTLSYVLRSIPLGALFAPLVLAAVALVLRVRLPAAARFGAVAALLGPALLTFIATDGTRFWSYMNFTALYAVVLLSPRLRGFGSVSPRGAIGAMLAVWAMVAVGIDQWPSGWPQPPGLLPDAVSLRFPSFRDALCATSRQGLCDKPATAFK